MGNSLTFDVMSDVKLSADIREEFSRWMREIREESGLSQKYVAKKIGITATQLSRIETGKSGTERDTVIAWARVVGVDENEALKRYKPENLMVSEYEIAPDVLIAFKKGSDWTEDQINLFVKTATIMAAGIRSGNNPVLIDSKPANEKIKTNVISFKDKKEIDEFLRDQTDKE